MVIPVSKLMSKTNEDDNINLLNRVFQVIFQTTETLILHEGIFKNTREVLREARAVGECFSHLSSALKDSQVLI